MSGAPLTLPRGLLLLAFGFALSGCSAARMVGPPLVNIPSQRGHTTVVLEPFFEQARTVSVDRVSNATVMPMSPYGGYGGYGGYYGPGYGPQTVQMVQRVQEKPLLARVDVLSDLHNRVMQLIKEKRPDWDVLSTGVLQTQTSGPLTLVRTVVGDSEIVGSNRTMKDLSFAFGLIIPPLLIIAATPVDETQRTYGTIYRYETDASALKGKLLRYPTQPDYAVDTRGLAAKEQGFGLDVEYEEGLFASEQKRDPVLIQGFSEQLANAIIALVEGL